MSTGRRRRAVYWLLVVLGNLVVIELCLSEAFFQSVSKVIYYEDPQGHYFVRSQPSYSSILYYMSFGTAKLYHNFEKSASIMQYDANLGYSHIPNSRGQHWAHDFDVTYSIGSDQERSTPTPVKPLGRLLFLGDSFTFGHGVNDEEAFPYLIAQHWPKWKVVNKAVMGWTTSHAYMLLARELERPDPPAIVIYAIIPNNITRNYIRRSWLETISKDNPAQPMHPHFELVDGKPVYQGLVNVAGSKPDSPGMLETEIALTKAFLLEMEHMCQVRQIPFVVVLLEGLPPYDVLKALFEKDVPIIDLSRMKLEAFPYDGHPNRNDHRRIAEAIESSVVADLLERASKQ